MATTTLGPFPVSQGDVLTGMIVQSGDTLRTLATGWVSFARVIGQSHDADGDDASWITPADFPAPALRKHSLIVKFGGGPWFQGGKDQTLTVPLGESGEVILRTNDADQWLWDNDGYWQVSLVLTRPDPPPPSSGPPQPTLRIAAMEVVQAIQRTSNQVRLVQGKRTVVRVFVDSGLRAGEDVGPGPNLWPGIVGSLAIIDATNGANIANLNMPLNAGGKMTAREAASISRESWDHSLNFELPPSVLNRSFLDIVATVTASTPPIAGPGGLATMSVRVSFASRPRQPLTPILITLTYPTVAAPAPSMAAFTNAVISGALPIYPVAEDGFVINPPFPWETSIDVSADVQLAGLLEQMATVKLVSSDPVDGIRCGLLPNGAYRLGIGAARAFGSWMPTFMAQASAVRGGFAHEMGHAFGVGHSMCRGDEEWYDRRNMPGRIDDVGLDVQSQTVVPKLTPDVMSYCTDQWCSVQFYQAVDEVLSWGAI
jgi:hypothetical protein